jgi:hypothetical protein
LIFSGLTNIEFPLQNNKNIDSFKAFPLVLCCSEFSKQNYIFIG